MPHWFILFSCPTGRFKKKIPAQLQICIGASDRGLTSLSRTLHRSRRSTAKQLYTKVAVKPARLQLWIASVELRFTQRQVKRNYDPLVLPHTTGRSRSRSSPVIKCDGSSSLSLIYFHYSDFAAPSLLITSLNLWQIKDNQVSTEWLMGNKNASFFLRWKDGSPSQVCS